MNRETPQDDDSWKLLVLTLREISIIKGINLNEISKSSGIKLTTLRRFFTFKFKPTLPTVFLVACAVDVNFFTDKRDNNKDLNDAYQRAAEIIKHNHHE